MPRLSPQSHFSERLIDQYEAPAPFWGYSDLANHDEHRELCVGTLCAICGLHITWYGTNHPWRHDAVVVGDLEREYEHVQTNREYRSNCREPAVFSARMSDFHNMSKGCSFELPGTSNYYFPYAADTDSFNGGPSGGNTVYIPMHRSCFHIAMKASVWDHSATSPLRVMFRVLRHRFQVNWVQALRRLPPPHDYYVLHDNSLDVGDICINTCGFQSTEGIERGYLSFRCFGGECAVEGDHYLAHDPLNITKLTSTLLANLEPRVQFNRTNGISHFRKRLTRLPNELKLLIFDYVAAAQDWPLRCTRLLGPRFWKTLFNKNHPCFAWLWDLDQDIIQRTDPHLKMDWELLFRKLSQEPKVADCFGGNPESEFESFRGVLRVIPPGLEGRRRIWKLLEEMYLGDRSTRWELRVENAEWAESRYDDLGDVEEVPVYWDKNGQQLGDQKLREL